MSRNLINITWAEDEDIAQLIGDFDEIEFCQEHGFYLLGRARDWIVMMNGDSLPPSIEINNDNETTAKTMNKEMINIIWADDEDIAQLSEDFVEMELREEYGLNLLGRARDAKQLAELIVRNEWKLDAVITDANMPFDRNEQKEDVRDRDLSGLNEVLSMKRNYKDVLFYIYSGRGKLLEDKYTSELNEFKKEGRIFYKNDMDSDVKMFNKIREDVEAHSTPEYQIHNRYQEEFEAAELIGSHVSELLYEELRRLYLNDRTISIKDFTAARKVLEAIKKGCYNRKIIPRMSSLNHFKNLLKDEELGKVKMIVKQIMPLPLLKELELFLDFTNGASHDSDLLKIDEYLQLAKKEKEYVYAYRIVCCILMDLLLWYKHMIKKYENFEGPFYEGSLFDDEVEITDKVYYIDSYFIGESIIGPNKRRYQFDKKIKDLKIGDKVGIIKAKPNKKETFDYYVYPDDYDILESDGK